LSIPLGSIGLVVGGAMYVFGSPRAQQMLVGVVAATGLNRRPPVEGASATRAIGCREPVGSFIGCRGPVSNVTGGALAAARPARSAQADSASG
jgi:hypothetical protein